MGQIAISDIIRAKSKLLNTDDTNVIRQRAGKHEKLEEALYMWFSEVRAQNAFITDQMLIEKAKVFGQDLNVDSDFSYSSGWLYKFKQRQNISQLIAHGESGTITFLKEAWNDVKQSTFVNCWRHTAILPHDDDADFDPEDEVPLRDLQR
ncbi:hypothetical protein KUTeg_023338 [Tegillarca granosa]|uniref:HTH CENPB-type domain-containing protein n=1 Tax=Tegillarca granosa TaxID=220873 RepID=A0ABQ9E7I8_TEGGR|nr:hypothetical protein KUTeg_023338 [Tegillarca granosa]